MNLFVVSTPLQLLNAIEAKKHFRISSEKSFLVIYAAPLRINHMKKILDSNEWGLIEYIGHEDRSGKDVSKILDKIKRWVKSCNTIKRSIENICNQTKHVETVFIGNYDVEVHIHIANIMSPKSVVLLDDGNAVIKVSYYRNKNTPYFLTRSRIADKAKFIFMKYMMGYRICHIPKLTYFTSYLIDVKAHEVVVPCNYVTYGSSRDRADIKVLERVVYFVGSPLVEQNIVNRRDFENLMLSVKAYFRGCQITYIQHPAETSLEILRMLQNLGIGCIKYDNPLEIVLRRSVELPRRIASFYSTALHSLNVIFSDKIEFISFAIPLGMINRVYRDDIEKVYDYYRTKETGEFKVIEI